MFLLLALTGLLATVTGFPIGVGVPVSLGEAVLPPEEGFVAAPPAPLVEVPVGLLPPVASAPGTAPVASAPPAGPVPVPLTRYVRQYGNNFSGSGSSAQAGASSFGAGFGSAPGAGGFPGLGFGGSGSGSSSFSQAGSSSYGGSGLAALFG